MPKFQPGVSGNPAGRLPGSRIQHAMAEVMTPEVSKTFAKMLIAKSYHDARYAQLVVDHQPAPSFALITRRRAAKITSPQDAAALAVEIAKRVLVGDVAASVAAPAITILQSAVAMQSVANDVGALARKLAALEARVGGPYADEPPSPDAPWRRYVYPNGQEQPS
jgi:hypothetical protein